MPGSFTVVATINVEVAYATPERQELIGLCIEAGANVRQALALSGLPLLFPELESLNVATGIFGKVCGLDTLLQDGDRVEIYRPLLADPKDLRRQRAAKKGLNGGLYCKESHSKKHM